MTPPPDPPPAPGHPRFSVVIPTCRRHASLAACLDGLTAGRQALPASDFEIIVSDDAPEGENAQVMVREKYPAVRWVAGPRRGPAANRNRGAAGARGAWLAFTDDDCVPDPGWLAGYAARLDQPGAPPVRVLEGPTTPGGVKDYGPRLTAPLNDKGGLLWSCNFAIERGLFQEIGGFDERFPFPHLEDVDLRLRLVDRGEAFPFVPAAVVAHPPRPVHSIRKWVRSQESSFYLAQKRGVPASDFGQDTMAHLRMWVHTLRHCRNVRESIETSAGCLGAYLLVACHWPFWSWKYPRGRGPADAPAKKARDGASPLL